MWVRTLRLQRTRDASRKNKWTISNWWKLLIWPLEATLFILFGAILNSLHPICNRWHSRSWESRWLIRQIGRACTVPGNLESSVVLDCYRWIGSNTESGGMWKIRIHKFCIKIDSDSQWNSLGLPVGCNRRLQCNAVQKQASLRNRVCPWFDWSNSEVLLRSILLNRGQNKHKLIDSVLLHFSCPAFGRRFAWPEDCLWPVSYKAYAMELPIPSPPLRSIGQEIRHRSMPVALNYCSSRLTEYPTRPVPAAHLSHSNTNKDERQRPTNKFNRKMWSKSSLRFFFDYNSGAETQNHTWPCSIEVTAIRRGLSQICFAT